MSLGETVINIHKFSKVGDTLLSTYMEESKLKDITDKDMRKTIKLATAKLDYPNMKNTSRKD